MTQDEITTKVTAMIADHLGFMRDDTFASNLAEVGFDSLDAVELTMALEEEFGIEIADDEQLKATVAEYVELVKAKLAEKVDG